MKLDFLTADKLYVDKANMRCGKKPDVADILPSIRKRGILQTLLVRPGSDGRFGILAGSRRFHAGTLVAEERAVPDAETEPFLFPCAILEDGDDAAAIEASLIENMARLDPDEVSRWVRFVALVQQGQTPEEIADTFALPVLAVRRTLALGNLLPRIRELYRREAIDGATVRHLTLASKARQRDWLALWDDKDAHCPVGWQLKGWLFGGQTISAAHALFDVEASGLATVADLFGEDRYVSDTAAFWAAQNAAIERRRTDYLDAGWGDVVIIAPTEHFQSWEYEKTPKRRGGRVYIEVRASGEVTFHEGYLSAKEVRRIARGGTPDAAAVKPVRPEVTGTMQTYIDLHRHAAVRAALLSAPKAALRLMVAHAIAGSPLWRVSPEPQQAPSPEIAESVETCRGETVFDEKRRAVLALLDFDPEAATVCRGHGDACGVAGVFLRLLDLPDCAVMEVLAVVMGETLARGSVAVEAVGLHLDLDMAHWWEADAAFFDRIRDRDVLRAILADVAGDTIANANKDEKAKVLKKIVGNHLDGADDRAKVERWVPKWMTFPPSTYTDRCGVGTVRAFAELQAARAARAPEPPTPVPAPLAA